MSINIRKPFIREGYLNTSVQGNTITKTFSKWNYNTIFDNEDTDISLFSFHGRADSEFDIYGRAKNLTYGRIDPSGDAISPKKEVLAAIGGRKTNYSLNFVAHAFETFQHNMLSERHIRNKKKLAGSPYDNFAPVRAWEDVDKLHSKQLENIFTGFFIPYLREKKEADFRILNFDHFIFVFINKFLPEVMIPKGFKLTRSGFATSRRAHPAISGLVIEVAMEDTNNDQKKYSEWLNNSSFPIIFEAAANFGFIIDKHTPWRFIANMNSPKMLNFYQGKGLLSDPSIPARTIVNAQGDQVPITIDNFYDLYYDKIYKRDIPTLKRSLFNMYNKLIADKPAITEPIISYCGENSKTPKVTIKSYDRERLSMQDLDDHLDDTYWLNQYFLIRLTEENFSLNDERLIRHFRHISNLNKYISYEKALTYVNESVKLFRGRYPASSARINIKGTGMAAFKKAEQFQGSYIGGSVSGQENTGGGTTGGGSY